MGQLQATEPSVLGVQVAYAGYFTPMTIESRRCPRDRERDLMLVNKYGRVAGSIDLADLAELYAESDDDNLKAHYREVAAENGFDLGDEAALGGRGRGSRRGVRRGVSPKKPGMGTRRMTLTGFAPRPNPSASRSTAAGATTGCCPKLKPLRRADGYYCAA